MLSLGIDIGTSSIKVAVVDIQQQKAIATVQYPEVEAEIVVPQKGWAEQNPEIWWQNVKLAIQKVHATKFYKPSDIVCIGITYQMHGLVCIDKNQKVLRNSIIWCDSRAVNIGNSAFKAIGEDKCLQNLLNSPGNFTASKLAWVKQNEPNIYNQIDKILLPGDYIALQFTGQASTTISALSEGVFWDFKNQQISLDVLNYFGFSSSIFPAIGNVFEEHGRISKEIAAELQLTSGIPITYKAGDQPNNAFSLQVNKAGEVAATAGTSGVLYAVNNQLQYDALSRVNAFAHVNHTNQSNSIGTLLCVNGTGIVNKWIKQITNSNYSYQEINGLAATATPGSEGLYMFPFGNGAERMLQNANIYAHLTQIDVNVHTQSHVFRAAQEGIAFALRYGIDIMKQIGIQPSIIKAGKANMFLSKIFTEAFVNTIGVPLQLYQTDGSVGAALGAAVGVHFYTSIEEAFANQTSLETIEPTHFQQYNDFYNNWKQQLYHYLKNNNSL
jgi:xylulokinase